MFIFFFKLKSKTNRYSGSEKNCKNETMYLLKLNLLFSPNENRSIKKKCQSTRDLQKKYYIYFLKTSSMLKENKSNSTEFFFVHLRMD